MDEKTPRRDPYRLIGEIFNERYTIDEFIVLGSFGAVIKQPTKSSAELSRLKFSNPIYKKMSLKKRASFSGAKRKRRAR